MISLYRVGLGPQFATADESLDGRQCVPKRVLLHFQHTLFWLLLFDTCITSDYTRTIKSVQKSQIDGRPRPYSGWRFVRTKSEKFCLSGKRHY